MKFYADHHLYTLKLAKETVRILKTNGETAFSQK